MVELFKMLNDALSIILIAFIVFMLASIFTSGGRE